MLTLFLCISNLHFSPHFYIPLVGSTLDVSWFAFRRLPFSYRRVGNFRTTSAFENEPPSVSSATNEGFPNPSWLCTFYEEDTFIPFIIYDIDLRVQCRDNSLGLRAFLLSSLVITKSPSTISSSDDWSESSSTNSCQSPRSDDSIGTSSARRLRDVAPWDKRLRFGCVKCLAANFWALTVNLCCFLSSTALRSWVAAAILSLTDVSVRMLVLPFFRLHLIVFLGADFGNVMMSDGDT